ncbi:MAG TPA: PfkB family carbohydrate kinase, partial [Anseongella sp.]|nr:PfkB family carbohydrate kinase [Anseongella sp.]
FYRGKDSWHAPGIPVTVSDTIGSGDSFLAAFIARRLQGGAPEDCLRSAVAMGSFIAGKKGGCPVYELSEYLEFLDKNTGIS